METELICKACNKPTKRIINKEHCLTCWRYFRDGNKIYELPDKGHIEVSDKGKIICHICGREYNVLSSHIRQFHNMRIRDYREQYGLNRRAHLTSEIYYNKMKNLSLRYNMDKQLAETGYNTRIVKGQQLRLNYKDREQNLVSKRNRAKRSNKNEKE